LLKVPQVEPTSSQTLKKTVPTRLFKVISREVGSERERAWSPILGGYVGAEEVALRTINPAVGLPSIVQMSLAASDAVFSTERVILDTPMGFWVGLGESRGTGMGVEIVERGFLVGMTEIVGILSSAKGEMSFGGAKKLGLK
jgi:hypothetical protein